MADASHDADSLAPGFLIAAPSLDGGPFEQSLILMVHHDSDGAMGFIVNKQIEPTFGELMESAHGPSTPTLSEASYERSVFFGGPVSLEQLWLIYHRDGQATVPDAELEEMQTAGELPFHEQWVLAGAGSVIEQYAAGQRGDQYLPLLGYAGWGPGQLEGEIEEGSWLATDFDASLLLDTPPKERWNAALSNMGLDPTTFMMMGGGRA
jgi:putative transcriptional regulator